MGFLKRPFFAALIGFVVFISVWYHAEGVNGPAPAGKKPVDCVGRIDDIQVGESGIVLVLCDVQALKTNSEQNISVKKLLIHDCSKQNLFSNSRPGYKLHIRGTFCAFEKAGNPGEFDEFSYYSCKGISGRIFAESASVLDTRCNYLKYVLFAFRRRAVEQLFGVMEEDDAGMLSAMLFGDRAYLPEEEKELYQRTGIGHILVISGVKTLSLVFPKKPRKPENSAFVEVYNAKKHIIFLGVGSQFLASCRFWDGGGKNLRYKMAKDYTISQKYI